MVRLALHCTLDQTLHVAPWQIGEARRKQAGRQACLAIIVCMIMITLDQQLA